MRMPVILLAFATHATAASTALAADCRAVPGTDDLSESLSIGLTMPEDTSAGASHDLASGGAVALASDNRFLPAFEADCGLRFGRTFLDERLRFDLASPLQGSEPVDDAAGPFGGPLMARMAVDLAADETVDWSFETSLVSSPDDDGEEIETHLGLNNRIGLFDRRLSASFDVGLSHDETGEVFGYAAGSRLDAELWRGEELGLTAFADYGLTSLGYADDAVDATADRAAWAVGGALAWGRGSFEMDYETAHDNVAGKSALSTRNWRSWNGRIGFDLSGLTPWLPDEVDFEQTRTLTQKTDPDGDGLDETDDRLELSLTWRHGGGDTTVSLSAARSDEGNGGNDSLGRAIGFSRSVGGEAWSLSAGAELWDEASEESAGEKSWRQIDLDLELSLDLAPNETLGFQGGLAWAEGDERQGFGLEGLLFELTYDLDF